MIPIIFWKSKLNFLCQRRILLFLFTSRENLDHSYTVDNIRQKYLSAKNCRLKRVEFFHIYLFFSFSGFWSFAAALAAWRHFTFRLGIGCRLCAFRWFVRACRFGWFICGFRLYRFICIFCFRRSSCGFGFRRRCFFNTLCAAFRQTANGISDNA